jgi:hypothetical protein
MNNFMILIKTNLVKNALSLDKGIQPDYNRIGFMVDI